MYAVRANQRALDAPFELGLDALQVGTPDAFGFVVGVADVVTDGTFFPANRANSSHFVFVSFQ